MNKQDDEDNTKDDDGNNDDIRKNKYKYKYKNNNNNNNNIIKDPLVYTNVKIFVSSLLLLKPFDGYDSMLFSPIFPFPFLSLPFSFSSLSFHS